MYVRRQLVLFCFLFFLSGIVFAQEESNEKLIISRGEGNTHDLYFLNLDGVGLERLTRGVQAFAPNLSSDGSRVVFHGTAGIGILDLVDRSVNFITPFGASYPNWSPDSQTIAYQLLSDGQTIWLVDADGSNTRQLTNPGEEAQDANPVYANDGSVIFFVRSPRVTTTMGASGFESVRGEGNTILYAITPDGSELTPLLELEPEQGIGQISQSSDGELLLFTIRNGDVHNVYQMAVDGSDLTQLTDTETFKSSPKFAPDDTGFFYIDTTRNGDEYIFAFDFESGNSRRVTNLSGIAQFDVGVSDTEFVGYPPIDFAPSSNVSLPTNLRIATDTFNIDLQHPASLRVRSFDGFELIDFRTGQLLIASKDAFDLEFDTFFLDDLTNDFLVAASELFRAPRFIIVNEGTATINNYDAYVILFEVTDGRQQGYAGTIVFNESDGAFFFGYHATTASAERDQQIATIQSIFGNDPNVLTCRVQVTANTANVRDDAGTNFAINFVLNRGETLTSEARQQAGNFIWYEVNRGEQSGWIREDLVSASPDCESLP